MTGIMAALIGLATILTVLTFVWVLSVRLQDASVAEDDLSNCGTVLDYGLWRYTRHPNYFGDATLLWGIYVVAASTPGGWLTHGDL